MNKLYALLLYGRAKNTESPYFKRHATVNCPKNCRAILDTLFGAVPNAKMLFVASAICEMVLHTTFRNEILKYDATNTYTPVELEVPEYSLWDVTTPLEVREDVLSLLDIDIRERLQMSTWPEFIGGVALHILRRAA